MLTTSTARIIFIGLSAATASSVSPSGQDDCGCVLGEGKFCGTDGQCHLYNCEEYYKYGPVEYTGYGPDAPGLECSDTDETEADENSYDSNSWR